MDVSSFAKNLLPQPALSFGVGGIEFFSLAALKKEQAGYVGSNWNKSWLVLARETACGDPIFIDQSQTQLPVYTAMHGEGSWELTPVASSWSQFLAALEFIRPYTKGREHPAGLEENPISVAEQKALEKGLVKILGSPMPEFWSILLESEELEDDDEA
ncbi:MAG: SMI1/KNR4 family protein [Rhodanobacter sp.]|jgi:hypothetical protein|nr:SMI1/KNR4 family protein [Rhodanobacter sp.]